MPESNISIGIVTIAHGSATAQGNDGVRQLTTDSPVYADDIITTGANGSAVEIHFNDGAILSQGPNSHIAIDEYIYDPADSTGEMVIKLFEGTIRSVSGEIVDANPEGFSIETPLATIGIRGTTTGHIVGPDGLEQHVVIDFVDKPVVITPTDGGPLRLIAQDGLGVTAAQGGIGEVGPAPAGLLASFEQLSSESLQESPPSEDDQDGEDEFQDNDKPADDGQPDATGEAPDTPTQPISLTTPGVMGQAETPSTPPAFPQMTQAVDQVAPAATSLAQTTTVVDATSEQDDIDTPVVSPESTPGVQRTIDLSDMGADLTISLASDSTGFYEETGDPSTRTGLDSNIVNAIGSETNANNMTGDERGNTLTGGEQLDTINGNAGDDTISGNGGGDNLDGGDDTDTLSYAGLNAGVDVDLSTQSSDYTINSIDYQDTVSNFENVIGSAHDDTLWGDNGDNTLFGQAGNDTLWGGNSGVDRLYGGDGDDLFKFHNNLEGTVDGGDDTDSLLVWSSGSYDLQGITEITDVEQILFRTAAATAEVTMEYADFEDFGDNDGLHVDSMQNSTNETVVFTVNSASGEDASMDLSDTTFGTFWTNGSGTVKLSGGDGNDTITGTSRSDTIFGNAGNDTIIGGEDGDVITGGAGADIFRYEDTDEGGDTINDFNSAQGDSFAFEADGFGAVTESGQLDASHFKEVSAGYKGDGSSGLDNENQHYVYFNDGSQFELYYDADGNGGDSGTLIATFDSDVGLDHTDITIV
ncbi:MAG: hypothetical protein CL942_11675 [Desulfovibrio sp.]|nr:hypothetical protein [Desulfovibrio sp.]|tara:strand:- start:7358 stop:9622 length:2265 start_codon:yes stop_codon:yes gene_type:complete